MPCCANIGSISAFAILGIFSLAIGLFTLFGFHGIYRQVFDERNVLQQDDDGQLSKTTFWWAKPPVDTFQDFYFLNIINPDEVEFFGSKPIVKQTGPFVVRNVNFKDNLTFSEDGNRVKYFNYRTFIFDESRSCDDCKYDSIVHVPNLVALGTLGELADPRYEVPDYIQTAIAYLMIFMGEYPFVRVKFGELVFDGYDDALLSAAHSRLVNLLTIANHNKSIVPVPFPDMHRMAFFNNYNNSQDREYEVYTGKDDLKKKGDIITWNGDKELPTDWWSDPSARVLKGSDSGQFSPTDLTEKTEVSLFQSYMCRSFRLTYRKKTSVHSIPTLRFESDPEEFDTTLPKNAGFRYANSENIKYFDNWPNCENYKEPENDPKIDCDQPEYYCHSSCGGAKFNGTYLMPPGMYPVNCYPGRPDPTPFRLLFSAPHFASSPKQVRQAILGYSDLGEEATTFAFDYEPNSGVPLAMNIRFQVSIPFGQMEKFPTVRQFPNNIFPVFWLDNHNHLRKNVLDELYFGLITVPFIADIVAYTAIGLFFAFLVLTLFSLYRYRKLDSRTSESL